MHPLFSKHPALWRVVAGLVVGVVLSLVGVGILMMFGGILPFELLAVFMAPVIGILSFLNLQFGIRGDVPMTLVPLLFYPVLCAVIGFFFGERQRVLVVVVEIVLAAIVLGFWIFGGWVLSQWEL